MSKPVLWIVIPCYNEEQVLPITAPMFLEKIHSLTAQGLVSDKSRVLFVNDGSRDKTWELIQGFAAQDEHYIGISQSRNRGHQNAVLAAKEIASACSRACIENHSVLFHVILLSLYNSVIDFCIFGKCPHGLKAHF